MKDVLFNVKDGERNITLTIVKVNGLGMDFRNPNRVVIVNEDGKEEMRGLFSLPPWCQPDEELGRIQEELSDLKAELKDMKSSPGNYNKEDIDYAVFEISEAEGRFLYSAQEISAQCQTERQSADDVCSLDSFAEHINIWNAGCEDWNDNYHSEIIERNGWDDENLECDTDICRDGDDVLIQNDDYGCYEVIYRPVEEEGGKL